MSKRQSDRTEDIQSAGQTEWQRDRMTVWPYGRIAGQLKSPLLLFSIWTRTYSENCKCCVHCPLPDKFTCWKDTDSNKRRIQVLKGTRGDLLWYFFYPDNTPMRNILGQLVTKYLIFRQRKNRKTRAGSLAALLFCHTVILSFCLSVTLSAWRTVYLPVCLTDFLTSCWHSEQLLFW